MQRICIVDDEEECIERLKKFILHYFTVHEGGFEIAVFKDGAELVKNYMPVYDIIYLDIEMPGLDGMQTAARIREADEDTVIIFLTRLKQFAVKGYEVGAFDYIVKPVDYNSFEIKFTRAIKAAARRSELRVEVRTVREVLWLPASSIYRIEVNRHELTYYTASGVFNTRGSLGEMEKKLYPYGFRLCSRYCLVNMRHVTGMYDWYLLVRGEKVEVSRSKRKEMMRSLVDYFGGKN